MHGDTHTELLSVGPYTYKRRHEQSARKSQAHTGTLSITVSARYWRRRVSLFVFGPRTFLAILCGNRVTDVPISTIWPVCLMGHFLEISNVLWHVRHHPLSGRR